MAFVLGLMKGLPKLKDPTESFHGKTVLVTGANTGLGLAAATKFAQLGASRLILAVRSVEKGEAAKTDIQGQQNVKRSSCSIEVWPLDMLSYSSIQEFATRVSTDLERLDVAVLNAGVHTGQFKQSRHGWESMLQVNTLSTTLLALLLLPKLRASRTASYTPTLELVGSGTHTKVEIDESHLKSKNLLNSFNNPNAILEGFGGQAQYGRSKLFLMYALEGLASLAQNKGTGEPDVYVTSVCPGPCRTDLARDHSGFFISIVKRIVMTFMRTTEEGARTLVSGTVLGERGHGQFWKDDTIHEKYHLLVGDEGKKLQQQVWNEIIDSLKKDCPEVLSALQS